MLPFVCVLTLCACDFFIFKLSRAAYITLPQRIIGRGLEDCFVHLKRFSLLLLRLLLHADVASSWNLARYGSLCAIDVLAQLD